MTLFSYNVWSRMTDRKCPIRLYGPRHQNFHRHFQWWHDLDTLAPDTFVMLFLFKAEQVLKPKNEVVQFIFHLIVLIYKDQYFHDKEQRLRAIFYFAVCNTIILHTNTHSTTVPSPFAPKRVRLNIFVMKYLRT